MAAQTELEELVVRLTGDPAEYLAMLARAQAATRQAASEIQSQKERISGLTMAQRSPDRQAGFAADIQQEAMERQGAAMREGVRLTEQLRTASERYAAEAARLSDLHQRGAISTDTYGRATARLQESLGGAAQGMGALAQAAAGALAGLGALGRLKDFFAAFGAQAAAERGLGAAIAANKRSAEGLFDTYKGFSRQIQETTRVSDQQALSLLRQAETYGLTGEAAMTAVRNAIALAAATDRSASSLIRATTAMAEGNLRQLRMLPGMRGITDQALLLAKAQQMIAVGWEQEAQAAQSLGGQIRQLANLYTDLKESLGRTVAESIGPAVAWLKDLVTWFQLLPPWVKSATVYTLGFSAAFVVVATAGPAVIGMLAAVKTAVVNLGLALLASPAAWGAFIAAGALAAVGIAAVQVSGLTGELSRLQAAAEETARLQDKLLGTKKADTSRMTEEASGIFDPEVRKAFGAEQVKLAQKELDGLKARVADSQKAVDGLRMSWEGWKPFNLIPGVGFQDLKQAREQLENDKKLLEAGRGRLEAAQGIEPGVSAKAIRDADELAKKLQTQAATFGMTALQAQVYKLKLEGATDAVLGNARGLVQMIEAAQGMKKLAGAVADVTRELDLEIDTMGMSADEVKLYKLAQSGATEAQLEQANALIEVKKAHEETNKMMEEGRRLSEQLATPQEKFAERAEHLGKLLDAGAIDWAVYQRAVKGAGDQLLLGGKHADAAAHSFHAAAFGSAEAASRIQEYQDRFAAQSNPLVLTRGDIDRFREAAGRSPEPGEQKDKTNALLGQIRDQLVRQGKKPTVEVEAAGLEE